ncbi:type II 3-dehydroquinate dehydratase [Corynebacterium xerosis]|uniref:3-dehydroquinate dehydratase n=1 Tax=Corynebacterium xerosis TaxID=1725 RepID=A0A6B8TRI7_9CORY|nr:type II 3-dehydroquinate dehydratase [Corynebacterium xerosis]QGS35536.1 type II 3-dehydroquinate dehydratase [Corynebacterium xerosis]
MSATGNPPTVVVLNGPNLDRLGKRQPEVYGSTTLADVVAGLELLADELGVTVDCRQSNHEGELIDWVHEAADQGWPIIINPGGLTHTSVALRDALAEVADAAGFHEVHISNVHAREEFRHTSLLSPLAAGIIVGCGTDGYGLALRRVASQITAGQITAGQITAAQKTDEGTTR